MVDLAVVHLEFQTNKIWQYGGRARLCPDRCNLFAWLGPNDWESDGDVGGQPCLVAEIRKRVDFRAVASSAVNYGVNVVGVLTGRCEGLFKQAAMSRLAKETQEWSMGTLAPRERTGITFPDRSLEKTSCGLHGGQTAGWCAG